MCFKTNHFYIHTNRFLAWIEETTTFVIFCFLVRIFLALGTACTNTAVFVIVMIVWPDQVAYLLVKCFSLFAERIREDWMEDIDN